MFLFGQLLSWPFRSHSQWEHLLTPRSTNLQQFKSNQVCANFTRVGSRKLSLAQNKNQRWPGQSVSHPRGEIKSGRMPESRLFCGLIPFVDGESGCHLLFLSFNAAPSNLFCACLVKFASAATEILLLLTRALILQHSSSGGGKTFVTRPLNI